MQIQAIEPIEIERAALALSRRPGFAWLDARRGFDVDGRFSFLAAMPVDRLEVRFGDDPFERFDLLQDGAEQSDGIAGQVPRWIGYVAFDAAWSRPVRGRPRFERGDAPVAVFQRYDAVLVADHENDEMWLAGDSDAACERLLAAAQSQSRPSGTARFGSINVDDASTHGRAIARALEYIREGEIYQVNLARRWSAAFDGDPISLWMAMRDASRVPLGLFLDGGDHFVLAATMERFLRWTTSDRRLVTKPIKGTIRRESGHDWSATLREDPKERAEHAMIVDLMRNDLGRVATTGSVNVDEAMKVEPFTGLYHLISTVSCETRHDVGLGAIMRATFPPGSVTGTPKVRAVEIIEELEQHPRGVYCGASGFIDRAGGLSLAVSIRTATIRNSSVEYWAGGGIVEASDPDKELAETELKARVFLDAAETFLDGS